MEISPQSKGSSTLIISQHGQQVFMPGIIIIRLWDLTPLSMVHWVEIVCIANRLMYYIMQSFLTVKKSYFKGYSGILSGKADPYVKVFMDIENQDTTPTVSDHLSPVWNHETYFKVYRDDDSIQFNVSIITKNEWKYRVSHFCSRFFYFCTIYFCQIKTFWLADSKLCKNQEWEQKWDIL